MAWTQTRLSPSAAIMVRRLITLCSVAAGFVVSALSMRAARRRMLVRAKRGAPCLAKAAKQGPLMRQVFISHTGQDQSASSFAASVLYPALKGAGLPVFMDFKNLEVGCEWPAELVDAAANSVVVVVVLSKQYTRRYWCMLELDLALHSRSTAQQQQQCQPLVIPVFYDNTCGIVKPGEIIKYWQHNTPASRQDWVEPQRWATNIRAMQKQFQFVSRSNFQASKDADYQLARRVVVAAMAAIPVQLHVNPVLGREQDLAELIAELVVPDPDRLGLWLCGLGGCGKTTLAQLLFNQLSASTQFKHKAFIKLNHGQGLSSVQLITSMLKQLGAKDFQEASPAEMLLTVLQEHVHSKEVMLVIDNVESPGDLDDLLPRVFAEGSCIIITSRSSSFPDSVWDREMSRRFLRHKVKPVSDTAAQQLFRSCASLDRQLQMDQQLCECEKDILAACGGLPLALQLAGALLLCKQPSEPRPLEEWQAALTALQQGQNAVDSKGRLRQVLHKTFMTLEKPLQHMFLDVATALRGQPRKLALAVWRRWHGDAAIFWVEGLERRNLLHFDDTGQLQTHDVLAALGKGILLDPDSGYCGRVMGAAK